MAKRIVDTYHRPVARRLTGAQLADESGVELSLIEALTEIGVITPDLEGRYTVGDVIRVGSVQSFLDAGMTLKLLAQGIEEGLFTFEYLDRFYPDPMPPSNRSLNELAAEMEVDAGLLGPIYLAMGLVDPDPQRPLRRDEFEILRAFFESWSAAGPDALLRAARLMGESARMISEGWTRLYVEKISDPLITAQVPMDQRIQTIVETTERAARLAPEMITWLLTEHMRHSIDQANIEGLEASMAEHGLVLPRPARLPAILFIDVSGYTAMTEKLGDEVALQTSEVVSEWSRTVARSHGGSVVKTLGDGAMLHFDRVADALGAAMELVEKLGEEQLPAHAGVHAGALIQYDGDYFGRTVNLASRVADKAEPGEVAVTQQVVDNANLERFMFEALAMVTLKGIDRPVALYRAKLRPRRKGAATSPPPEDTSEGLPCL